MPQSRNNTILNKLFNPDTIAVIGASRDPKKVGAIAVRNIVDSGFKGKIYPVNPKAGEIQGFESYKDIASIPKIPDLAIISLPGELVLEILRQIQEKGTQNVVIYSAGFGETGDDGKKEEEKISRFARKHDLNILGPNCFGFVNNIHHLNTTFGQVINNTGNLRFISQSGALAASIFDWAKGSGMGFNQFVTLGNKAVLNENDILSFWSDSLQEGEAIGLYLESISDGEKFLELISKISKKHPVFILKPGKSKAAKKAMQSHTGSLAGEDDVLDAALKQNGVTRCYGIEDMFDMARAFSWTTPPAGPNVEIISNAGGPAVISADMVSSMCLSLAKTGKRTKEILKKNLPREASLLNPVDVLGDAQADRFKVVIEAALEEDGVDSVVVILTPQLMTEIEKTAELIGQLHQKHKKPIFCSFVGGEEASKGEKILSKYKIPSFRFPERAIRTISFMWKWNEWVLNKDRVTQLTSLNGQSGGLPSQLILEATEKTLSSFDVNRIMKDFGLETPDTEKIVSAASAIKFTEKIGFPVVLKISSTNALHKTERKGVITNIYTEEALVNAFNTINKLGEDMIIQKQIQNGIEVITGIKTDVNFGKVIMFGAGGTLTELIKDKNLKILPIEYEDIVEMVENSKIYKLFSGFRGAEMYDLGLLYENITRIIKLVEANEKILEFEINPLIVTRENVFAVDGKIILK